MKKLLLIILSCIVFDAFSQNVEIRTITETKYNANNEIEYQVVEEYDNNNVLIKYCYYNSDLELERFRTFTPIVNNESTEISFDKNSEVDEYDTTRYDAEGEVIYYARVYPLRGDGPYVDEYEFDYDENGNIIKEYRIEDGHNGWIYTYEFNKKNQKIKMSSTYNNEPAEEYTFKYVKGNLVEEKLYDYDNEDFIRTDNTYWYYKYKNGKRISKKTYSVAEYLGREIINFETYAYNKQGLLKEVVMFEEGDFEAKKVYEYTFY